MMATTSNVSNKQQSILAFLNECQQLIQNTATDAKTRQAALHLRESLQQTKTKPYIPKTVPVLQSVDEINDTPLARQFQTMLIH